IDLAGKGKPRDVHGEGGLGQRPTVLRISPDGKTLAVGGLNGSVRLLEGDGFEKCRPLAHSPTHLHVEALAYRPDGKCLASAEGPLIRLWDPAAGKELLPPEGHIAEINAAGFAGWVVVTGGRDGTIRAWDVETGRERDRLRVEGGFAGLAAAPGGEV